MRPAAIAVLHRWRESLLGVVLLGLGLWWASTAVGLVSWIGYAVALIGLATGIAGLQRGRFRIPGRGPGVVKVVEGQIIYLGPLTGGTVALSELIRIGLDPTSRPVHWVLTQPGHPELFIPVSAEGSEALFDAFASVPGFPTEKMLSQLKHPGKEPTTLWHRDHRMQFGLMQ